MVDRCSADDLHFRFERCLQPGLMQPATDALTPFFSNLYCTNKFPQVPLAVCSLSLDALMFVSALMYNIILSFVNGVLEARAHGLKQKMSMTAEKCGE